MMNIRLPNITATTEREQLMQVKSYLHQLAQELNWALSTIEAGNSTEVKMPETSGAATKQELATSFNSLKALIIKSSETVQAYSEEAERRYESLYVAQSDFGTFTEEANQLILENANAIESFYENMQEILTEIDTVDVYITFCLREHTADNVHDCRLTCTVRSEKTYDTCLADFEIDVTYSPLNAVLM